MVAVALQLWLLAACGSSTNGPDQPAALGLERYTAALGAVDARHKELKQLHGADVVACRAALAAWASARADSLLLRRALPVDDGTGLLLEFRDGVTWSLYDSLARADLLAAEAPSGKPAMPERLPLRSRRKPARTSGPVMGNQRAVIFDILDFQTLYALFDIIRDNLEATGMEVTYLGGPLSPQDFLTNTPGKALIIINTHGTSNGGQDPSLSLEYSVPNIPENQRPWILTELRAGRMHLNRNIDTAAPPADFWEQRSVHLSVTAAFWDYHFKQFPGTLIFLGACSQFMNQAAQNNYNRLIIDHGVGVIFGWTRCEYYNFMPLVLDMLFRSMMGDGDTAAEALQKVYDAGWGINRYTSYGTSYVSELQTFPDSSDYTTSGATVTVDAGATAVGAERLVVEVAYTDPALPPPDPRRVTIERPDTVTSLAARFAGLRLAEARVTATLTGAGGAFLADGDTTLTPSLGMNAITLQLDDLQTVPVSVLGFTGLHQGRMHDIVMVYAKWQGVSELGLRYKALLHTNGRDWLNPFHKYTEGSNHWIYHPDSFGHVFSYYDREGLIERYGSNVYDLQDGELVWELAHLGWIDPPDYAGTLTDREQGTAGWTMDVKPD